MRPSPRLLQTFILGSALAVVAACDGILSAGCTDATCFDGILVAIQAPPHESLTVEAVADDGERRSANRTCFTNPGGLCHVPLVDFLPDEVTITVISGTESASVQVRPDYELREPNGYRCWPKCRNAKVIVEFDTLETSK